LNSTDSALKTALITGGSGFCARHLAKRLSVEGGTQVIGADWAEPADEGWVLDDFARVDIGEFTQVADLLRRVRPDFIFHLAGIQRGESNDIYRTNVMGAVHLLEAVRQECPSARVLLAGSAAEYGFVGKEGLPVTEGTPCRPLGPYGMSKYAATLAGISWSRQYRMKVVIARPFNIIGAGVPPSLVVGALVTRVREALTRRRDPVVKVGNLDSARDFVAVEDAVDAYVRMSEGDHWGEIFNICSGQPTPIRKVVETLLSFAPRPVRFEVDPALFQPGEVSVMYGSYAKARAAFGFEPATLLRDALRECWIASIAGCS